MKKVCVFFSWVTIITQYCFSGVRGVRQPTQVYLKELENKLLKEENELMKQGIIRS